MSDEFHTPRKGKRRPLFRWLWWALPAELKVTEQVLDVDLTSLEAVIERLMEAQPKPVQSSPGDGDREALVDLVNVAVETWRLRRRVEKLKDLDLGSRVTRPLESTVGKLTSLLQERGVEIEEDYEGRPFEDGFVEVIVLAEESDPSKPEEFREISETVSPSVLHHGQRIRRAEVIVTSGVGEENELVN